VSLIYDALKQLEAGVEVPADRAMGAYPSGTSAASGAWSWLKISMLGLLLAAGAMAIWMIPQLRTSPDHPAAVDVRKADAPRERDRIPTPLQQPAAPVQSASLVASVVAPGSAMPNPSAKLLAGAQAVPAAASEPMIYERPETNTTESIGKVSSRRPAARKARIATKPLSLALPTRSLQGQVAVRVAGVETTSTARAAGPRVARRKPLPSVQQLVERLRQAIARKQTARVRSDLQQLDHRAGVSSLIALRMHAYWALQQSDFTTARSYYQRILEQRPNDLPAGSNMALIEWRSGDTNSARTRLRQLRELYPDSGTVRQYLSTMESS